MPRADPFSLKTPARRPIFVVRILVHFVCEFVTLSERHNGWIFRYAFFTAVFADHPGRDRTEQPDRGGAHVPVQRRRRQRDRLAPDAPWSVRGQRCGSDPRGSHRRQPGGADFPRLSGAVVRRESGGFGPRGRVLPRLRQRDHGHSAGPRRAQGLDRSALVRRCADPGGRPSGLADRCPLCRGIQRGLRDPDSAGR